MIFYVDALLKCRYIYTKRCKSSRKGDRERTNGNTNGL